MWPGRDECPEWSLHLAAVSTGSSPIPTMGGSLGRSSTCENFCGRGRKHREEARRRRSAQRCIRKQTEGHRDPCAQTPRDAVQGLLMDRDRRLAKEQRLGRYGSRPSGLLAPCSTCGKKQAIACCSQRRGTKADRGGGQCAAGDYDAGSDGPRFTQRAGRAVAGKAACRTKCAAVSRSLRQFRTA